MDGSGRNGPAWAEAAALFEKAIEATRDEHADPSALAVRAALLAASAGLRYWSEFAALCASRTALLAGSVAAIGRELPEPERRRMLDDLHGLARDMGDLALREAHRFQAELDALTVETADRPAADAPPRRYARAKS